MKSIRSTIDNPPVIDQEVNMTETVIIFGKSS